MQASANTAAGLFNPAVNVPVGSSSSTGQPGWFSNPKKRVIPNHFVPKRKTGFQIATTATSKKDAKSKNDFFESSGSSSFNLLSFGSSQRKSLPSSSILDGKINSTAVYDTTTAEITKYDETINKTVNEDFSLYDNDDDLPPSRSMYDLNDEILLALDKPNSYNESFINQDPKSYSNVFNRDGVKVKSDKSSESKKAIHPLQNGESAILVFGYPEQMANQVIQHFQEFGTVLEDFEATKSKFSAFSSKQRSKIIPCFSGKSWVKITYDNPASALDSLQENGSIFNGVLLGVIPYTKDAIEKLQNRKLAEGEDIGGGVDLINTVDTSHKVDNSVVGDNNDIQASYVSRLEIKDGSDMLLKSGADPSKPNVEQKQNNEKLGLIDTALKFVFGFNEL